MLFISIENVVEEVDVKEDDISKKINGDLEIVRPRGLPNLCLLVDEEGLLKQKPINKVGSLWYGYLNHGHPIVGDILVSKLDGEGNLIDLSIDDIAYTRGEIMNMINYAWQLLEKTKQSDIKK
jgi:hypothetical protein